MRRPGRELVRRARWAVRERAVRRAIRDVAAVDAPLADDPLLVIAPHLDDAVLSCGQALAAHPGSTVVTVMTTANEERRRRPSEWDLECGFRPGDDVMAVRKEEDRQAMALLRATPVWLDLVEADDDPWTAAPVIARTVAAAVVHLPGERILLPLGIDNVDHVVISDAVLGLELPGAERILYADLPYAERRPDLVAQRLHQLEELGLGLEPVELRSDPDLARKRAAVHRYETQLRPLWPNRHVVLRPERYWRVLTGS